MPQIVDDSSFTKSYFFKDLFLSSSLKSVFKYLCICNLNFSTPDMFETNLYIIISNPYRMTFLLLVSNLLTEVNPPFF